MGLTSGTHRARYNTVGCFALFHTIVTTVIFIMFLLLFKTYAYKSFKNVFLMADSMDDAMRNDKKLTKGDIDLALAKTLGSAYGSHSERAKIAYQNGEDIDGHRNRRELVENIQTQRMRDLDGYKQRRRPKQMTQIDDDISEPYEIEGRYNQPDSQSVSLPPPSPRVPQVQQVQQVPQYNNYENFYAGMSGGGALFDHTFKEADELASRSTKVPTIIGVGLEIFAVICGAIVMGVGFGSAKAEEK